jgi:hypothetical protein
MAVENEVGPLAHVSSAVGMAVLGIMWQAPHGVDQVDLLA